MRTQEMKNANYVDIIQNLQASVVDKTFYVYIN